MLLDPALFILFACSNYEITTNFDYYNIDNPMIRAMWKGLSLSFAGLVVLGILFGILYYICENDSELEFFQVLGRVIIFSTFPFLCLYIACCIFLQHGYIDIPSWRILIHILVISRLGSNIFSWFSENLA